MNLIKKIRLHFRFRKKRFGQIGESADYRQLHSKFLSSGNIFLGDFSKVLDFAYLDGVGGIEIGIGSVLAPHCTIITSNHYYDEKDINCLPYDHRLIKKKVTIGRFCWIGRNVMIMPGVTIADGAVVAAGSVVVKDVGFGEVVGGNPARLIKTRDKACLDELIKAGHSCHHPDFSWRAKEYI